MEKESGISIYDEHTTLIINKPKNRRSIVMQLTFKGLEGLTVYVPNVFKGTMNEEDYGRFIKDLLIALKSGLNDTDGSITRGKPRMGTSNLWQIIA
ncbi:hypothetical protein [Vulcanisaeta sp. JCM 14467]